MPNAGCFCSERVSVNDDGDLEFESAIGEVAVSTLLHEQS